ncbi:MAG: hypothetical protein HQ488_03435 [Parcubacteria group bacterium]|nr:hypothetical protein [Parcubacteria group bacterium]
MPVFKQSKNNLETVRELKIGLEKDLQELTENNIETVFNLKFVATEFQLNNLRIDTLAFDTETSAFVIIEYKRDKSFSVVDQGFAYLALMLNNKADFILEYNEQMQGSLKRDDIDWSQSRVLFLAHSFTTHQREAINFKDLPIELWEVRKYENSLFSYNPIKAIHTAESIKTVTKDETVSKVSREVKTYTVADHFKSDWNNSHDLFDSLRDKLLSLDSRFEEAPTKQYIGYKIGNVNVVAIHIYKSKVRMDMTRTKPKDVNDPEKQVQYVEKSMEHWNQDISYFEMTEDQDIDYAIFLAKQLLERFAKKGIIKG